MNINRHNYEEFFLMYVDNELSAADRRMVEQFVTENPDLATELDLLSQATLLPEEVDFSGKEYLLKQEPMAPETMEQMLLMLDAELDVPSQTELNRQIQAVPLLQKEWDILQQTKLNAADTVACPNKELLYRQSSVRVISMRILRVAVAAALIAFVVYLGATRVGRFSSHKQEMVNTGSNPALHPDPTNPKGTHNSNPVNQSATAQDQLAQSENPSLDEPVNQASGSQKSAGVEPTRSNPVNQKAGSNNNLAALDQQGDQTKRLHPSNPTEKPERKAAGTIQDGPVASNNVSEKKSSGNSNFSNNKDVEPVNKSLSPERQEPTLIAGNKPEDRQKEVRPLSALDTDIMQPLSVPGTRVASLGSDEKDPNEVLFLDESKVKKSKLNGMFRKLKRTIARNTNIQTGHGVKIAGFEIAVR